MIALSGRCLGKSSELGRLADRDARPGQCKPPFGGKPNARTKLPTFAIQRPLQPVHVLARGADKLEPSDLQRRQLECNKIGVPGTEVREIHQRQVGPELLVARDTFVVVQEITAAIEDEPVLVHLDGFGMMRRMAMNDGSVRPVDQLVREPPLRFRDVVAPVRPPMHAATSAETPTTHSGDRITPGNTTIAMLFHRPRSSLSRPDINSNSTKTICGCLASTHTVIHSERSQTRPSEGFHAALN